MYNSKIEDKIIKYKFKNNCEIDNFVISIYYLNSEYFIFFMLLSA